MAALMSHRFKTPAHSFIMLMQRKSIAKGNGKLPVAKGDDSSERKR
jgi:hypothetical protein